MLTSFISSWANLLLCHSHMSHMGYVKQVKWKQAADIFAEVEDEKN